MPKKYTDDAREEILIDYAGASIDFLKGAYCVGGFNQETQERMLYYLTGYRHFETFVESEIEGEE